MHKLHLLYEIYKELAFYFLEVKHIHSTICLDNMGKKQIAISSRTHLSFFHRTYLPLYVHGKQSLGTRLNLTALIVHSLQYSSLLVSI